MIQQKFTGKGVGVALVTPFKESGAIDFNSLAKVINHCINGGVDYLVALGTTGETPTLSEKESRQVLDFILTTTNNRIPVIVGVFGLNNTAQLIEKTKSFNFDGFAGILSSSPSYNKPSQEGIYQHYMRFAEVAPLPIVIYNVPSRTGSKIQASTVIQLAHASKKFIAVKDATANMVDAAKIVQHKPESFQVLSGDDPTCLPLLSVGGSGLISVLGNLFPSAFSKMVHAANNGDISTARAIHLAMIDLHKWLYIEGNPVGLKIAMDQLNMCPPHVRLPLVKMGNKNAEKLRKELSITLENLEHLGINDVFVA